MTGESRGRMGYAAPSVVSRHRPREIGMPLRPPRFLRNLAVLVSALAVSTCASWPRVAMAWQPDGVPIATMSGLQLPIAVFADGVGGAYVFWYWAGGAP